MKKILLAFVALIPVFCNAQLTNSSFMNQGLQRDYSLYVPASYNGSTAVPLILNFHGFGGNGLQQYASSGFKSVADTAGFIFVSPTGTPLAPVGLNHWNVGGWTATSTIDDVNFASALIDTLLANYNIDPTRIYATGLSNGGVFSNRLACQLGNRIAAIASVAGTFTPQMQSGCNPVDPTPVLQIHGTTDGVVPYDGTTGNGGMISVDTILDYWVTHNNCSTTPTITPVPDINTADGSTVEHIVYANGANNVSVELFKITNGGHDWPGTNGNMDINSAVEIWKFFSQYSNYPLSTSQINNVQEVAVFPNPFTESIRFKSTSKIESIYIFDQTGRTIYSDRNRSGLKEISLPYIKRGIYFYTLKTKDGLSHGKVIKN